MWDIPIGSARLVEVHAAGAGVGELQAHVQRPDRGARGVGQTLDAAVADGGRLCGQDGQEVFDVGGRGGCAWVGRGGQARSGGEPACAVGSGGHGRAQAAAAAAGAGAPVMRSGRLPLSLPTLTSALTFSIFLDCDDITMVRGYVMEGNGLLAELDHALHVRSVGERRRHGDGGRRRSRPRRRAPCAATVRSCCGPLRLQYRSSNGSAKPPQRHRIVGRAHDAVVVQQLGDAGVLEDVTAWVTGDGWRVAGNG